MVRCGLEEGLVSVLVKVREQEWGIGLLTFHSRRMISPRSSSPAPTATSTSHSSISAGSSSTSSESMSTENCSGERRTQPSLGPLRSILPLPIPAGPRHLLFVLLPEGGSLGLEKPLPAPLTVGPVVLPASPRHRLDSRAAASDLGGGLESECVTYTSRPGYQLLP